MCPEILLEHARKVPHEILAQVTHMHETMNKVESVYAALEMCSHPLLLTHTHKVVHSRSG